MNCSKWQDKVLLAGSGELSGRAGEGLREHLAACPECRAFQAAAERTVSAARAALPAAEPSAAVLRAIREYAAAEAPVRRLPLARPWIRILAYAAALVAVAGAWMSVATARGRAERINQIHTIAAMVSSSAVEEPPATGAATAAGHQERLRALGRRLLELEGLLADESLDAESAEFNAPLDSEPTTRLQHSIDGSEAETHV